MHLLVNHHKYSNITKEFVFIMMNKYYYFFDK
jgi:hypothetical protein